MKKKTVTFKSSLETSDDLNIVMKEPDLNITPPQPIIKKESLEFLSRATKVACGAEPIVLQSRLDLNLKNFSGYSIDKLDKLNSLSFRSSTFGQSNAAPDVDDDDNNDDNEDDDDDGDSRRNGQSSEGDETESEQHEHDGENGSEKRSNATNKPRHSHRTKKPNKKFLDDVELAHLRNGKKGKRKLAKDDDERTTNSDVDRTFSMKMDGLVDCESSSSKGKVYWRPVVFIFD